MLILRGVESVRDLGIDLKTMEMKKRAKPGSFAL